MTQYGYARVSTEGQSLDSQVDALLAAGVAAEDIRQERMSGTRDDRPVLNDLLGRLEEGDALVVVRLDRLGRSLQHLVAVVDDLGKRGVDLVVVDGGIDTGTAQGRLVFAVMAALAEFEAALTRERVSAGLESAKRRGVKLGRPATDPARMEHAIRLHVEDGLPASEVRRLTGVAESTLYEHMRRRRAAGLPPFDGDGGQGE